MRYPWRLLAAGGLQFLLLFSVIGFKQYTVTTGERVLLKVAPADPRSPFSGEYVSLNYEISTLQVAGLAGDKSFFSGAPIYVELSPGEGGYWQPVSLYHERRDVAGGHVLIKGKVRPSPMAPAGPLRVDYGIEDVFIPEGSGGALASNHAELGVEVAVDRFGNAVARNFLLDGRPLPLKRR